jgi:hypothetical protein
MYKIRPEEKADSSAVQIGRIKPAIVAVNGS